MTCWQTEPVIRGVGKNSSLPLFLPWEKEDAVFHVDMKQGASLLRGQHAAWPARLLSWPSDVHAGVSLPPCMKEHITVPCALFSAQGGQWGEGLGELCLEDW